MDPPSATAMFELPGVEQSGSSKPMMYWGAVVRALKAESREASVESTVPAPQSMLTALAPLAEPDGAAFQSLGY